MNFYHNTTALTPAPFVPRLHQTAGVHALIQHGGRFSVAEITVAGGKSDMLGMLAQYYSQFGRVIIVAHNKELVKQNSTAVRRHGVNPGICSSSISTNAFARVTVGTIGSIVNRVHLFRDVVAVLVDEVHMVPPAKSSQYRRLFDKLLQAKIHGLTGTPFRADGTGDLAKTFGPIVFRYTFLDALRDGYVKPLVPIDAGEDETIDVTGLKSVAGDFDLDEMAPRAMKLAPSHAKTIVEVMQKFNRRRALVFCCNIAHVDKMEETFKRAGVPRVYGVHSRSIDGKRDKSVEAFRNDPNGGILVSCNMFNTGFDVVDIDYMAICRATKSAVWYAQGLGRGARPTPYAVNCLVSDFGGNIVRHGTLDAVMAAPGRMLTCDDGMENGCGSEWETWAHGRTCPKCELVHKSAPKCKAPDCGERFDPHYHGMRCPHCGQQQADIKTCAACEQAYAAFLHPICPFCGFDNTINIAPGKDLNTRGGGFEAVNVRKIIEQQPWQDVVSPPVKSDAGGWLLTTKYTTALWPYEQLPQVRAVFLKRSPNGRYMAAGLYDINGALHQR